MQTVAAANVLRGGLIALPISRKPASRRPRTTLIAGAKKADTAAPPSSAAPAPEDAVPSYFLPPTPEAGAPQQPAIYQAVPQYPVAPPPAPAQSGGFWSSVPPLVWVGVGILAANIIGTALNFVKGGPQKMQEMAMKTMMDQMMKQAMKGAPPGAAGANPFAGMPGGFPGGMPGAAGGFPGGFPGAGFPPPPSASTAAASQPPIDTTASPASSTSTSSASPSSSSSAAAAGEGSSSGSSTRKKSAFKDVDTNASTSTSTNGSSSSTSSSPATPPPFTMPPGMSMPPPGAGAGATSGAESAGSMLDMLKNPEMQKMLYPYLPEPMRNPETFEWMLNSPEYRAQLEGMLSQQMGGNAPAAVQELIKDADMSPDKMKEQFDALGMTPEEFVGKVMSDPDLATSMTKPSVMAAIAECTKNPMSIFKYQNDEEVMRVFEKMSAMFPQAAGMGAMPGSMPPPPSSS